MSRISFNDVLKDLSAGNDEQARIIDTAVEVSRIVKMLVNARVNCGLTQRELAEKCGLKQSAIARMESLQAIPRLDTIIRVAKGLGITIEFEKTDSGVITSNKIIYLNRWNNNYSWNPANNTVENSGVYRYGTIG